MNHITTALIKSIYLAQLHLNATGGVRIEVDQSVIDAIKEVKAVYEECFRVPAENELSDADREQIFKDACNFDIKTLNDFSCKLNKTHMRLVVRDRVALNQHIAVVREYSEREPKECGAKHGVWTAGWKQFIEALEEHPYFFLKPENL